MNKNKEIKLKIKLLKLKNAGKYIEAKNIALQLSKASPKDIEVWYALAQLQSQLGEHKKAVVSFSKAYAEKSPFQVEAIERAVDLCVANGFDKQGLAPGEALIKMRPKSADAHFKYGMLLFGSKHYIETEKYYLEAIKLDPDNTKYQNQCGLLYVHLGENERSLPYFEKCQALKPESKYGYYFHLWSQNYIDGISDANILADHQRFGDLLEQKYTNIEPFDNKVGNRLKIGFVSQDFYKHSVAYFFLPIIKNYSKENWEVFCYSDVKKPDHITQEIESACDHWCESQHMSDRDLYKKIRSDKIDIVIDLVGILGEGRLDLFAMKAAPVQINYLGYPNTTGLSRMDYRLTDEWSDPVGMTDQHFTEKLTRLKTGFLCFQPNLDTPPVSPLPALGAEGVVTYGSFNIYQKISPRVYRLWAEILKSVPNSRLLIKSLPFVEDKLKQRVIETFRALGVEKERLELIGWTIDRNAHLKIYDQVDIHLDSFPYNGTTTTCEAMWQGIPTLTLAGENHRSRVGASIMHQVNLQSWVANSDQEYVDIAVRKSADLGSLQELRQSLRNTMLESPLLDSKGFISELESKFNEMIALL